MVITRQHPGIGVKWMAARTARPGEIRSARAGSNSTAGVLTMAANVLTRPDSGSDTLDVPVLGMHCVACAARIEKALARARGVSRPGSTSPPAGRPSAYDPAATDPGRLREVVAGPGLRRPPPGPGRGRRRAGRRRRRPQPRRSTAGCGSGSIVAAMLTVPVLVLAMAGHLVPAWEAALAFPARPWIELALTTPVLFWAGWDFLAGAWKAARAPGGRHEHAGRGRHAGRLPLQPGRHRRPGLVHVGAAHAHGERPMPGVYYEVAASIVALILLGNLLQARATDPHPRGHQGPHRA